MNIQVELLHNTPLSVLVRAIRQCYESQEASDSYYPKYDPQCFRLGHKDRKLVDRIINSDHTSTLEHITYNFQVKSISRLNLQELARHRMASLSVKSTRYTLKELKNEDSFIDFGVPYPTYYFDDAGKYINLTGIEEIDTASLLALEQLRILLSSGKYTNDQAKYAVPECYKLDLIWTINARSLRNFLHLRSSHRAHFEIREFANLVFGAVPESHKFLYESCVHKG